MLAVINCIVGNILAWSLPLALAYISNSYKYSFGIIRWIKLMNICANWAYLTSRI